MKKAIIGILLFIAIVLFAPGLLGLIIPAIVIGMPILIIYAIYRAVIGIMTHDAELKRRQRDNDRDSRPY